MQLVTPSRNESARRALDAPATTEIARWLRARRRPTTCASRNREAARRRDPGQFLARRRDRRRRMARRRTRFVLRTDAPSGVAASLSRAQEFAVLRVAHAAGVTAPRPLFLCRDTTVIGRAFFIMQRIPGVAQGHRLTRERALVPDGDALAEALGANLARIHAIRPPTARRARRTCARPARRPRAPRRIAELSRLSRRARRTRYPALEWGLRWCETACAGRVRRHADPPRLPHRQLSRRRRTARRPCSTGSSPAGAIRAKIIGWFTARCWRFGARRARSRRHRADRAVPARLRVASRAAASTRADLDYWQVMAHLRWAIIALQQAQRHIGGGERSLELALTGRIVHELEYELLQLIAGGAR